MSEKIDVVAAVSDAVEAVRPKVVSTIARLDAIAGFGMSKDEFDDFVEKFTKEVAEAAVESAVKSVVNDVTDTLAGTLRDVSQMDWEAAPCGKYQEWYDAMEEAAVIVENFRQH